MKNKLIIPVKKVDLGQLSILPLYTAQIGAQKETSRREAAGCGEVVMRMSRGVCSVQGRSQTARGKLVFDTNQNPRAGYFVAADWGLLAKDVEA